MLDILHKKLVESMKLKDKNTINGLRNFIGKIKAEQINKGDTLSNQDCIKILSSYAKQLNDSIEIYRKSGRDDLMKKEEFELVLIKEFLPKQKTEEEILIIIKKIIQSTDAKSIKDMGQVMGIAMKELAGSANGKIVQNLVKEALS